MEPDRLEKHGSEHNVKGQGIPSTTKQLPASQEVFCSMEIVRRLSVYKYRFFVPVRAIQYGSPQIGIK
jgi:hypothetical protein